MTIEGDSERLQRKVKEFIQQLPAVKDVANARNPMRLSLTGEQADDRSGQQEADNRSPLFPVDLHQNLNSHSLCAFLLRINRAPT